MLNREHVAAPVIAARQAVDEWGGTCELLSCSGRRLVGTLASRIERWTGNAAQVVAVGPDDVPRMRKTDEPIIRNWERNLVVLSGDRAILGSAA